MAACNLRFRYDFFCHQPTSKSEILSVSLKNPWFVGNLRNSFYFGGQTNQPNMAELFHTEDEPQYVCWDRKNYSTVEEQLEALKNSRTVYIGNLSFFTKESQIYETFAAIGPVKRVIMGLNNISKTPCGFCFVEFYNQEHAHGALKYITDTVCDERVIRCDADGGFLPGRQYGRGKAGGQIRDEWRTDYDPARGRFMPPSILGNKRDRDDDRGGRDGRDRDYNRRDRDDNYRNNNYNNNRRSGGGGGDRQYNNYNNNRGNNQYKNRSKYNNNNQYNNNNDGKNYELSVTLNTGLSSSR